MQEFVTKQKLKHPILLMGGKTAVTLYDVEGFPSSFWIDSKGRIVGREVGFDPELVPEMEKKIEKFLKAREK